MQLNSLESSESHVEVVDVVAEVHVWVTPIHIHTSTHPNQNTSNLSQISSFSPYLSYCMSVFFCWCLCLCVCVKLKTHWGSRLGMQASTVLHCEGEDGGWGPLCRPMALVLAHLQELQHFLPSPKKSCDWHEFKLQMASQSRVPRGTENQPVPKCKDGQLGTELASLPSEGRVRTDREPTPAMHSQTITSLSQLILSRRRWSCFELAALVSLWSRQWCEFPQQHQRWVLWVGSEQQWTVRTAACDQRFALSPQTESNAPLQSIFMHLKPIVWYVSFGFVFFFWGDTLRSN